MLTDPRYEQARKSLLQQYGSSNCMCSIFVRRMAEQFPELRKVPGYIYPPGSEFGRQEHWWLETAEGQIVDPTADQFRWKTPGRYVRYDPKVHLTSKGTCMGCGGPLYLETSAFCSRSCAEYASQEYHCAVPRGPFQEDLDLTCDADIYEKHGLPYTPPC